MKRLGDANYEGQLIRQQLIAQTGNNVLSGEKDESQQMKNLMDNAASEGRRLGLSYGDAPSEKQLKNLKKPMVWMVETKVGNQTVLAPVVYLPQSVRDMITGGAEIAADNIDMDLESMTNTGGSISAKNNLKVSSKGDITNTSGTIKGGNVDLSSTEGSIINETAVAQWR